MKVLHQFYDWEESKTIFSWVNSINEDGTKLPNLYHANRAMERIREQGESMRIGIVCM